ncbi:MAG: TetR/AcrR family transcriptional repressor of nem operon [Oleiphilaceae bacterium]|jgi:TetR/AcrR family transcriptional repressor of nem operon
MKGGLVVARKIEFDKAASLQKAMRLFWLQGYETTSVQDLVDELGINRFSIYNSFGDKKTLFLAALEHYRETVFEYLLQPLMGSEPAKQCLENYLNRVSNQLKSKSGELGCMIQNTSLSLIGNDQKVALILAEMYSDLRDALRKAINDAKISGEISKLFAEENESDVLASYILCQIQGVIILRRALKETAIVMPQIKLLRLEVASW